MVVMEDIYVNSTVNGKEMGQWLKENMGQGQLL